MPPVCSYVIDILHEKVSWVKYSHRLFSILYNLARKVCVSWALSLVECVAVWVLMLTHIQAPYTGVLKTHESQSLSGKLPEA